MNGFVVFDSATSREAVFEELHAGKGEIGNRILPTLNALRFIARDLSEREVETVQKLLIGHGKWFDDVPLQIEPP